MEETIAQVIADTAAKERTEDIIAYILKWDSRQAQGELANAIRRRFLGNPMSASGKQTIGHAAMTDNLSVMQSNACILPDGSPADCACHARVHLSQGEPELFESVCGGRERFDGSWVTSARRLVSCPACKALMGE